jgi:hypothetical protein
MQRASRSRTVRIDASALNKLDEAESIPGDADQARSPRVTHPALIRDDWQTYLFHASIQTRCRVRRKVSPSSATAPAPSTAGAVPCSTLLPGQRG